MSLDTLAAFDAEVREIEEVIDKTTEKTQEKVDWTRLWGKKYPVLLTYSQVVETEDYAAKLQELLARLKRDYGYGDLDAFLVLKDILAQLWKTRRGTGAP